RAADPAGCHGLRLGPGVAGRGADADGRGGPVHAARGRQPDGLQQDRPDSDGKHGALGAVAGGGHALHPGPGRDLSADRTLAAALSGILTFTRSSGRQARRGFFKEETDMRFKRIIGAAALAFTALAAALPAQAADYKSEYKLSIVVGTNFPWGQGAVIWSDLVRERTNGRINIKVYPGTSLVQGDQTREFTAIRQGVIDMAIGSTINWSPQVKELNLFSLPFLMPDYPAIDALTQGKVGEQLFDILSKKGVVPLAWGENGYRQLSNSAREVKTPEDVKGMKLRVVGSPLYIDIYTALGANPTQMSWADAQPALASGAVD